MIHPTTRLQIEKAQLENQVESLLDELQQMRDFMRSEKFHQDPTIQTADVMALLDNVRSNHLDRVCEPWGWSCDIDRAREWRLNGSRNFVRGA